jgi:hypothetical protein
MQIQMIHRLVHSEGNVHTVYEPGDIYEASEKDAEILISQGSAVALEDPAPVEAPKKKRVV